MKKIYDLVLVGATALSAGIVQAHPELSIAVLESGCSVASEFANTFQSDNAFDYTPKTILAAALKGQFCKRNAMSQQGEWLPAVSPVLSDIFLRSSADVYFFAAVTGIHAQEDCYRVDWNAFGIPHCFRALQIIDTTAKFSCRGYFSGKKPGYHIALNHIDTSLQIHSTVCDDPVSGRFSILEKNQDILRIAPEAAMIPAARRRNFGAAAWIPSAARGNFLKAFDDGAAAKLPKGSYAVTQPRPVNDGPYDVIVVGLGTAGSIAAITAKKEGLKVLGIENLSVCGGAGTAGSITGYYYGYKGGIYRDVDKASARFDPSFLPMNQVGADQKIAQLNAELSGCDIRLNATFTHALCKHQKVTGVVWYENGVRHTARAKFVIDATAEAAVCVSAGCRMLGGRTSDGYFQPYSCRYLKYTNGQLVSDSMDQGRMDQYDPDSLGAGILRTYACYLHLLEDYGSREYLGIVPLFGLREGLRIRGEETVEFAKLISGQFCKKPVYWCWSNFDNHGKDNALESQSYQDWVTLCGLWGWGLSVPLPMGALIPEGFEGLLAAGRCVSVDHDTSFAVRMKDDVQKSGEAAAQIAALAIREGIQAKDVDVDVLRSRLLRTGCLKPEDEILRIEKQQRNEVYEGQLWCDNEEMLAQGLASDSPGYYMWSAAVLGKKQFLHACLESPEEKTRFNAALALSMLPQPTDQTVAQLCACALKKDGYIARSGRKYVYPRSVAAIYALGRTGSVHALPALYQLMEDESFIDSLSLEKPLLANREDYYFQYRSHIICALCKIAEKNQDKKSGIHSKLLPYLEGKALSVTLIGSTLRFDVTDTLHRIVANTFHT